MSDWMKQDLPTQNPREVEGGLHAEQNKKNTFSIVIVAARKRKSCTPTELQKREGRNDSLKPELEEYLKKSTSSNARRQMASHPVT